MLKFRGHQFIGDGVCACCVGDARVVSIDPTGTGNIRAAFNSALMIKWSGLRVLVRKMIVDEDLLSMGSKAMMQIANPAIQNGATKIQMFQRWFDYIAQQQVLGGDGSWIRDYIRRSYDAGQSFAQTEVGAYFSRYAGDREQAIFQLAVVEIQGIIEAVSQQAVRAVATGLLNGMRPAAIVRSVHAVIDRTGSYRSSALVELITIKAFAEATLDVYESAGVARVGLLPEQLLGDAKSKTAKTKVVKPQGPGKRSRKTPGGPSERTVRRIKAHERSIEALGALIAVKTAGDKKVCLKCKAIAKKGPYKINTARSLIPAHPRCRCVFVPVVTKKVKDAYNPKQPRGKGEQGGQWVSTYSPEEIKDAEDQWNDYEGGDLIKRLSRGERVKVGELDASGGEITAESLARAKKSAKILQSLAKRGRLETGFHGAWRGIAYQKGTDVKALYKRNQIVESDALTAVTRNRTLAEKYTRPDYIGETESKAVLLNYQRKSKVIGHQFSGDFDEAVLPKGARYRVSSVREDGNVTIVTLYDPDTLN